MKCDLCPRKCLVDRKKGEKGICGQTENLKVARAALHFWEEPCISGDAGSGAVFFSGCPLHCVFCQNENIANGMVGKSELMTGGKKRPAILADSVEAVIAAMFLDGGLEPTKKFIIENLKDEIEIATKHVGEKDYKTVLQEELQKNGDVKIEYKIIKETGKPEGVEYRFFH